MSKRRRKPGRLFWLRTFAVGVYSPNKGQRRVAAERASDKARIEQVESDNAHLMYDRTALLDRQAELIAQINDLEARLEINDGIRAMDKVKTTVHKVSATIPLRAPSWATTDPSVINNGAQKDTSQVAS